MNTQQQIQAMDLWLASHPSFSDPNATPRVLDDEATLLRSHGLSVGARREQRRPVPLKVDELGWGNDGRWHPEFDGSAA